MYNQAKAYTEAQKEYSASREESIRLLRIISRKVDSMPRDCMGDWGKVGSMQHLLSDLQQIHDRIYGVGEYADNEAPEPGYDAGEIGSWK